jgi:hypothetical protein
MIFILIGMAALSESPQAARDPQSEYALIAEKYPDDRAAGFLVGDV